ncbi:hypothetical protein [Streptococcus hyointestinalis]|uniref:hypothetical protein n=1 Tax=Streptococcus hyointestinalis TaxID=1337 RepID=UPI0013E0A98A|nr:hypothetical protein [Streptococcus hyointestinalis]
MYIFIVLVGVLMYSILYKLGLKVYDNLYGRTLLAILLFQPIILVGLILSEYLLSDSGYSITSEFLVSFFNEMGFNVRLSPMFDVIQNVIIILAVFIALRFLTGKSINKIAKVEGISYDDERREIVVEGKGGVETTLPLSLLNTSVLFSVIYMLIITLSLYNWYLFSNHFGNVLQNIVIVLAVLAVIEFFIMTYEMIEYMKEQSIRMVFQYPEDYLSVMAIFDLYIENREVVLSYLDIDSCVKQFIEKGIFRSAFKVDFNGKPSEYYRIDIAKELVDVYESEKKKYL